MTTVTWTPPEPPQAAPNPRRFKPSAPGIRGRELVGTYGVQFKEVETEDGSPASALELDMAASRQGDGQTAIAPRELPAFFGTTDEKFEIFLAAAVSAAMAVKGEAQEDGSVSVDFGRYDRTSNANYQERHHFLVQLTPTSFLDITAMYPLVNEVAMRFEPKHMLRIERCRKPINIVDMIEVGDTKVLHEIEKPAIRPVIAFSVKHPFQSHTPALGATQPTNTTLAEDAVVGQ